MEYKDLDERVEWEARRVAAAFGIKEWEVENQRNIYTCESPEVPGNDDWAKWSFDLEDGTLRQIMIGDGCDMCDIRFDASSDFFSLEGSNVGTRMARGLYRLGYEDDEALRQFPLSAHEKMELRLNFPREFWPQEWLEEESDSAETEIWSLKI